jgi:hypothetical protein
MPNYQFSTPCFLPAAAACELPDSDASKEGFRIPDSVARILKKRRRQKRVVGNGEKTRHAGTKARRQNPVVGRGAVCAACFPRARQL